MVRGAMAAPNATRSSMRRLVAAVSRRVAAVDVAQPPGAHALQDLAQQLVIRRSGAPAAIGVQRPAAGVAVGDLASGLGFPLVEQTARPPVVRDPGVVVEAEQG